MPDPALTTQLSSMQDFHTGGQLKSGQASIAIRTLVHGTRQSIFIDSQIARQQLTADALLDASSDTLYVQAVSGAQGGRAIFHGLKSNKEATITLWNGNSMPNTVRINVGKLITSASFVKSAIDADSEVVTLMDKTSKEQRAFASEVEPLFDNSPLYKSFLQAIDPQVSKPPLMRWWCIAIFCVPAAGLIGFAIPHCRRGD